LISTCPNRFAQGVDALVIKTGGGYLVYVLDGTGSWGAGVEAAAWFRWWISSESSSSVYSPAAVMKLLAAGLRVLPRDLSDDGFHWSFSLAVAICGSNSIQIGASGSIAAVAMSAAGIDRLFAPRRLVDDLVTQGTIALDEAETHKYRRIICGPFFGQDNTAELEWSREVAWSDCNRVVLGDAALPRFLDTHEFVFETAIQLRDAVELFGGASMPTVILTPP